MKRCLCFHSALCFCSLGTMIKDLTLPILSFFTGISFSQARHPRHPRHQRRFRIILPLHFLTCLQAVRQALGGSSSIEDLLIPFFCISTNLSQLDQEVSFSGSSAAFAPSASRAGPRKRQIMACSARFDDRGRPHASYVEVSPPCG